MTRFHYERPDGNPANAQNILIHLNEFVPPQGFGGEAPPPVDDLLEVTLPAVADATFEFYKFYQIKEGQATVLQTDMPLVIIDSLPAGTFQDLTNGFDVRVFDSNGVGIPYESIDIVVNGDGSADIEIHFKMPIVTDGELIQLAFGKAAAGDGSNPGGVYDSNYKAVYHLNQTTFGINSIIDSTSNGNDCNDAGAGSISSETVGPVGKAIRFGSESAINCGNAILESEVFTVSMWVNIDDIIGGPTVQTFFSLVSAGFRWDAIIQSSTTDILFRYGGAEIDIDIAAFIGDGEKHLWTFTWDQPNSIARIYIDGILFAENTTPWTLQSVGLNTLFMGNAPTLSASTTLIGFEDEPRFSNIIRDSDWILTEFNNQNDNDAFWDKLPRLDSSLPNILVEDNGDPIKVELQ